MDDADAYLKRVAKINKKKFGSNGYLSASRHVSAPTERGGEPFLPSRRKKRERSSEGDAAPTLSQRTDDSNVGTLLSAVDTAPSQGMRVPTINLIDKWFPGNALKVSSISVSASPPLTYTEATVKRFTSDREKMLLLRGGVEDLIAALSSPVFLESEEKWSKESLRVIYNVLRHFASRTSFSSCFVKKQIREFQRVKTRVSVPCGPSAAAWHEYLNQHGPETNEFPWTSDFLFPSSASITILFTILTQKLLRRLRILKGSLSDEAMMRNKDEALMSEARKFEFAENTPEAERDTLLFFRLFMPSRTCSDDETYSGYATWLTATLTCLDTPLDPDTHRLANNLFHTCCEQLRALGELKGATGDRRGALIELLSTGGSNDLVKSYNTITDVGREEVFALYTLIIPLAKIFRQNENRLIIL